MIHRVRDSAEKAVFFRTRPPRPRPLSCSGLLSHTPHHIVLSPDDALIFCAMAAFIFAELPCILQLLPLCGVDSSNYFS